MIPGDKKPRQVGQTRGQIKARELIPAQVQRLQLKQVWRQYQVGQLVFAKVLGPGVQVGVIAWTPFSYQASPWWRSSDRARELLTETAGYVYELLLNSGRPANSPKEKPSADSLQAASAAIPDVPFGGIERAVQHIQSLACAKAPPSLLWPQ